VVIQIVQHLSHPPIELAAWPDDHHATRLVFITRHIREREVRNLLACVCSLAEQSGRAEL